MTERIEARLKIPAHSLFLETALSFITNMAKTVDFSREEVEQIRLAAEEAITNVIKHGYGEDPESSFEIVCTITPHQLEISIREKGRPFFPETVEPFTPERLKRTGDTSGIGIFLIQRFMDRVEFRNRGREGKETVLVKFIPSQRFDRITRPPSPPQEVEEFSFTVRDFRPEDAFGISECAYSTYGYTYESYIYYPSKIIEMNRTGAMTSFVACTESGVVAGHVALKYYNNPHVAELGVGFVRREYRKAGIFSKLTDYAIEKAKTTPHLDCLFVRAVTSHTLSQEVGLKRGFVPCALTLATFPSDVEFKGITAASQKDAAMFMVVFAHQREAERAVHPPVKHKEMVAELLEKAGCSVRVVPPETRSEKKPRLSYHITDVLNIAEIYCSGLCPESLRQIHDALRRLRTNGVDAVYLYLDLEDPNLPEVAEGCERMGFFFAGVLPFGVNGHHALILQYLSNPAFDFSRTKVAGAMGERIKNYVKRCYEEAL